MIVLIALLLSKAACVPESSSDTLLQLSASGGILRSETRRHLFRSEEELPFLSPQIAAEVSPSSGGGEFPWAALPLCQFNAEGDFTNLVRVFVNTDNTRAFVFDQDAKGAQTKVQCHGATPGICLRSRVVAPGTLQSCSDFQCECQQVTLGLETVQSHYVRQMIKKVGPRCIADGGAQILQIGLGGGALSSYLLAKCDEGTRITSIEKDPRIIAMAKQFFGLVVEPGKNEVENLDAGTAIQQHLAKGRRYDFILIDCFESHGLVPEACRSRSFIEGTRNILKTDGVVIQQVWASQYNELFHAYNEVFGPDLLSAETVDNDLNYLIIGKSASERP